MAIIKENDIIKIDIPNRKLEVDISKQEINERLKKWNKPKKKLGGLLKRYSQLTSSAAKGAVYK